MKITPAHDFNDYQVGKRHKLPMINIFTDDAHLNGEVPKAYQGLERFAARKKVVADIEAAGSPARRRRQEDHAALRRPLGASSSSRI